jgi:hypothetical protein
MNDDADHSDTMNVKEFHDMVLHILANVHATFSAADMLALGRLINEHDANKNEKLDIKEFKTLAKTLVKENFIFTGREGPDTLDLNQLDVLRKYNWKRRKMQKLEEGDKGPDNQQDQIDADCEKDKIFDGIRPSEGGEAPKKPEPIYVITKAQEDELEKACQSVKELCANACFPDLRKRADALNSEHNVREPALTKTSLCEHKYKDLLPLIVELKKRIHDGLQRELKQRGNNQGFESLFDHTENANYEQYLDAERLETKLHKIWLQHVCEIAAKLHKEGVIEVPTLEWDGSLGREEEVAIERLGFLLNA